MADPVLNTWGGLDLKLPPVLDEAKSDIQSVLSIISAALDITLMILDIAKTFSGGVLNPTRAIIQAVVNALNTSIQDMRRLGIYLHYGDYFLMRGDPSLAGIRGGYDAYERRMIGRLLDNVDPGRPKFGNQSAVVSLFFYTAGDISEYERIWAFIKSILKFFGQIAGGSALPVPAGVKFAYGTQGTSVTNLMSMNPFQRSGGPTGAPDQINLTWALAPANSHDPSTTFPPIPPNGFMVEVSTIREGLLVAWTAPVVSGTGGRDPTVQTMTSGFYADHETQEPLRVYDGVWSIAASDGTGYNTCVTATGFREGSTPAYLLRNPTDTDIIPIDLLNEQALTGQNLFGRTFYTTNTLGPFFTGGSYSITIRRDQLPYEADLRKRSDGAYEIVPGSLRQATTVYVRVYSCSKVIDAAHHFRWNIVPRRVAGSENVNPYNSPGTANDKKITQGSRSQPSSILTVNLPTQNGVQYLDCVRTALAVVVLSRSDLPPSQVMPQTGLEGIAREVLDKFISGGNLREWLTGSTPCTSFRSSLLTRITGVAQELIQRQAIPESLLAPRLARFRSVLQWKWSDTRVDISKRALPATTILESLQDSTHVTGVNKNFDSIGLLDGLVSSIVSGQDRIVEGFTPLTGQPVYQRFHSAGFTNAALGEMNRVPILICMDQGDEMIPLSEVENIRRIWVARQLFDTTLLETCKNILQIVATPEEAPGQWLSIRPIPTGLPFVEDILRQVSQFCQRLADSTQAASDLITNFINFYKQRVLELQNLVNRIKGLVNQIDQLLDVIPPMKILITTSRGTDGVVSDLMGATSKPTDGQDTFATGIVALAGGAPTILIDLIKATT